METKFLRNLLKSLKEARDLVQWKTKPKRRDLSALTPDHVWCVLTGQWASPPPDRYASMTGPKQEQARMRHLEWTTWCGRDLRDNKGEGCFVDASHAALNAAKEGRLLVCKDCALAIAAVLIGQRVRV